MKTKLLMAAIACIALFSACDKQGVPHTGDDTGNLYGIWQLDKKTEVIPQSGGNQTKEIDFSGVHFYLAMSNVGVPHALAKKGSFTQLDLKDVDVDGTLFTYNAELKQISFQEKLWLTEILNLVAYDMELKGTFDVLELTSGSFIIQQKNLLGATITYAFKKTQAQ